VLDDLRCRPVWNDASADAGKREQSPEHQGKPGCEHRNAQELECVNSRDTAGEANAFNPTFEQPCQTESEQKEKWRWKLHTRTRGGSTVAHRA
jgi:hypothetical protein